MNLDDKFHPLNVGFHQSYEQGVFYKILDGYRYCIYQSSYILNDKKSFEYTIRANKIDEVATYSVSIDLVKTNREFYESVGGWQHDIPFRFEPIVAYAKSGYRKFFIDEVLADLE